MVGILFALLGGFFKSVSTVARKKLTNDRDTLWLAWLIQFVATIGFILLHLALRPFSELISTAQDLWPQMLIIGFSGLFAQYYNLKAIRLADLSELVPLYSMVPIVTLFVAAITIGELTSYLGIFGIFLITVGAYFLNIGKADTHLFDPILNIARKKSSQYVFVTVLCWGITPVVDRYSTTAHNPISWATLATISVMLVMSLVLALRQMVAPKKLAIPDIKLIFLVGAGIGLGYLMSVLAVNLVLASFAIAIRRMDIIFTMVMSWMFLHDPMAIKRLKGAGIMVIGAIIVALS